MAETLTRRQRVVYEYLLEHQDNAQSPPTLGELCRAMGLRSRGSLHKHIQALIKAGFVEPMEGKQRGVRLMSRAVSAGSTVPFLGFIAAGRPIEAVPVPENIEVPEVLRGKGACYSLKVRGNSMEDTGILDGDWIVVEPRDSARNGEIVVALIDSDEVTLKRIEQTPDWVTLHPANSSLKPVGYKPDRVQIQGVLVGQMRSYR